jgi:formate transporter
VAAGFEHSIANIYFISIGLFIKAEAASAFWTAVGKTPADFPNLNWSNFLIGNLLPVTIGNVIGGSIMVGVVYWFVYCERNRRRADNCRHAHSSAAPRGLESALVSALPACPRAAV